MSEEWIGWEHRKSATDNVVHPEKRCRTGCAIGCIPRRVHVVPEPERYEAQPRGADWVVKDLSDPGGEPPVYFHSRHPDPRSRAEVEAKWLNEMGDDRR